MDTDEIRGPKFLIVKADLWVPGHSLYESAYA